MIQSLAALCGAAAQALAFTATAPIIPGGGPRIVRAGLAIALTPLLWQIAPRDVDADPFASIVERAIAGAALGMSAAVVTGAVKAAGGLIDTALGSPPFIVHGSGGGPVDRVYQLAYAVVLFASGGFTAMVWALARASFGLPHSLLDLHGIVTLADVSMRGSLLLAGPSLFAQALAALAAGLVVRASPGLGGVLFGASFSSAFVLLALAVGASVLMPELLALARETVALSANALR